MSDLNKIINEQCERIAELEQENALLLVKTLPECNCEGLQERISELTKLAETADRQRNEFAYCLNWIQNFVTVDSETKDAALSRLKDIIVYDQIKASKSLNKFAIEQQIKGAKTFSSMTVESGQFGWSDSQWLADFAEEYESQLLKQLNWGE